MTPITLTIPGPPRPQLRHRKGRNGRYYDPSSQDKGRVRTHMLVQVMQMGLERTELAQKRILEVDLTFGMPIPNSWSQKRSESVEGKPHTSKPDIDNLRKLVFDAGNGILWPDDSIIAKDSARKIYSKEPYTIIHMKEVQNA
mgnify:CR=1 FL=1